MNTRVVIVHILNQTIYHKHSLSDVFLQSISEDLSKQEIAFIKKSCFGVVRWYYQLNDILEYLLHTPLKTKDQDIACLILLGLHQLLHSHTPEYAAVSETVNTCKLIKKTWATGLVNKLLRRLIQEKENVIKELKKKETYQYAHPTWIIEKIKTAWPEDWEKILLANNQKGPLTLRVNTKKITRDSYLLELQQHQLSAFSIDGLNTGITLEKAVPVNELPHFKAGFCSVQDTAGQFAATLLDLKKNQRVLDACAAPGSKTCHILETQPDLSKLVIMDQDNRRLLKVKDNIMRLGLNTQVLQLVLADAAHTQQWWDGGLFDRILLDPPCSATGVIRRHPDIKLLRQPNDINQQAQLQMHLLIALWKLLKPKGKLLYSTCSILPEENEQIISTFLAHNNQAKALSIELPYGTKRKFGWQILPSENGPDGFYYCLLTKH